MKLFRVALVSVSLLLAGLGFSQFGSQFTADQKAEVLAEIGQVLNREAFVPGVDLGKWKSFVQERKARIDEAGTAGEFANAVNSVLDEFGVSHIRLLRSQIRRRWGGEEALQGRRTRRMPALGWIEDGAALLRIPSFEGTYDRDGVAELMDEAKDAKYLVIDLRGNPGGEVNNMRQFLGLLLPTDTPVGTFVSRKMAVAYQTAERSDGRDPVAIARWAHQELRPLDSGLEPFKGKVAVLVDGDSASAAEIVANSLRESIHAPVVGAPTMGAVLVSTLDRLSYGFQIQFPVGDYVSHGGHRLEGHPIAPDISAQGDDAVTAALTKLKLAP